MIYEHFAYSSETDDFICAGPRFPLSNENHFCRLAQRAPCAIGCSHIVPFRCVHTLCVFGVLFFLKAELFSLACQRGETFLKGSNGASSRTEEMFG